MELATNRKKPSKDKPKEVQEEVITLNDSTKGDNESNTGLFDGEVQLFNAEGASEENKPNDVLASTELSKFRDVSEVTKQVYSSYRMAMKKLAKIKKYDEALANDMKYTLDKEQNELYSRKSYYLGLVKEIQLTLPLIAKGEKYDQIKLEHKKELADLEKSHEDLVERINENNNKEFQDFFNKSFKLIATLASIATNRGALSVEEEELSKQIKAAFPINVDDSVLDASFKKLNNNNTKDIFECTSELVGKVFKEDISVPILPKLVKENKNKDEPNNQSIKQKLDLEKDVKLPKKLLNNFPFNFNFEKEDDELVEDLNDCDSIEVMQVLIKVPGGGISFLSASEIGVNKSKGKDSTEKVADSEKITNDKVEESKAIEAETPVTESNEPTSAKSNPEEGVESGITEIEPVSSINTKPVTDDNAGSINNNQAGKGVDEPQPPIAPTDFNSQPHYPIVPLPPHHGHPIAYQPHNPYPHPDPNNPNAVNYTPYNPNSFCTQPPFPYPGYVPPPTDYLAYPQPPSSFVTTTGLHIYSHTGAHSSVKIESKPRPVKIKSPKGKEKEKVENWADSDQESSSEKRTSSPANEDNNKDIKEGPAPAKLLHNNNYLPPQQHYNNNYNHQIFYPPPYPNNPPMYPVPNWNPNNYYSANSGSNARKNNSNNNYHYKGNKNKPNNRKNTNEDKTQKSNL